MKLVVRIAVLMVLLFPALSRAQENPHPLAGPWAGYMVEGDDSELVIELQVEGEVVTGPIVIKAVGEIYIRNGSVTPNSIHFTTPALDPAAQGAALVWTGQLMGNGELAFSVVTEGADGGPATEFVVKRRPAVPGGR